MDAQSDDMPNDLDALKAELTVARAKNADDAALIARQKLEIAKLKRELYSTDVLSDIQDDIGGVRLSRTALVEQALTLLEGNRVLQIIAEPGVRVTH